MSKNFLSRIILVFLGTVLMGIGIEIIVVADQGFDSVSTLILGLMNHSTIPFGRWSQLISSGGTATQSKSRSPWNLIRIASPCPTRGTAKKFSRRCLARSWIPVHCVTG